MFKFSENLFHYIASYMFNALPNRQVPSYFEGEINENKWKHMFLLPDKRTDAERIFGIFLTYRFLFLSYFYKKFSVFTLSNHHNL